MYTIITEDSITEPETKSEYIDSIVALHGTPHIEIENLDGWRVFNLGVVIPHRFVSYFVMYANSDSDYIDYTDVVDNATVFVGLNSDIRDIDFEWYNEEAGRARASIVSLVNSFVNNIEPTEDNLIDLANALNNEVKHFVERANSKVENNRIHRATLLYREHGDKDLMDNLAATIDTILAPGQDERALDLIELARAAAFDCIAQRTGIGDHRFYTGKMHEATIVFNAFGLVDEFQSYIKTFEV